MFTRCFTVRAGGVCLLLFLDSTLVCAQQPVDVQYQVPLVAAEASPAPAATETHQLSEAQAAAINYAYGGGGFNYRGHDHCRAGCPECIRPHAIGVNTRFYGGYYVGGGVPLKGEGPTLEEGTFGWDYFGILFNKRIALNWTHGRRYQAGGGVYKTDGPKREHKEKE